MAQRWDAPLITLTQNSAMCAVVALKTPPLTGRHPPNSSLVTIEALMTRCFTLALLVLGATLTMHSVAEAQSARFRSGELVCDGGRSVGLIIGSNQNLRCVFRSLQTGRRYTYSGRMSRLGLDLGITSGSRLMWAVLAANTTRVKRSTLAGTYVGAAGDASFGVGAGANVLIGGFNRSITLQPLSIQGQVGVNLAVGVASLTLR